MDNIFTSSSRQRNLINQNGSFNVFCYQCGDFICETYIRMGNRAQCELCRRIANGEHITEDAIRQYKLLKAGKQDVSLLVVPDELPRAVGQKFSLRSLAGEVMNAIGLKIPKTDTASKAEKSTQVAKQKRRPRIFQNVDLQSDLGNIEALDKKIGENK